MIKSQKIVNSIELTKEEQDLLYEMVSSHISWREGGCLHKDSSDEVDPKKIKVAEKILKKI